MKRYARTFVVLLVAAALVAACGGDDGRESAGKDVTLAEWANLTCDSFEFVAVASLMDDSKYAGLSPQGAFDAFAGDMSLLGSSLRLTVDDLDAVNPPDEASFYHRAILNFFRGFSEANAILVGAIESGTASEAELLEYGAALARLERTLGEASADLSADVDAAIDAAGCG